jgi:hypothetical protein
MNCLVVLNALGRYGAGFKRFDISLLVYAVDAPQAFGL